MKMVRNLFLTLILVNVSVFAAGIPEVKNTDNITMGRGANGDDKEFIFNIGDGATNPKLLINDISKLFNFNKGLLVAGDGVFSGDGEFTGDLKVGDGANSEQFMSFRVAGEEVGFKFDTVTGEVLQKKKAGDAYKKLGSGSGSGSLGINGFGEDDNANAEDGTTSWSNTGGTFISFDNTAPNEKKVIEGERSFRFTPSAQNDVVVGPTLNFDFTKFHGRTCELGIEYTGADENLELHIVDANGLILNEDLPNNRKIQARSESTGPFSVSFQCPRAADILGDANKGNLHVEIKNVGASVSPAIDWDLTYIGTDRNLGTTTLPDRCNMVFNSGTGAIVRDGCDGKVSFSNSSAGINIVNYSDLGLTVNPSFLGTITDDTGDIVVLVASGITTTSAQVRTASGSGVNSNRIASLDIIKHGADAQQKVQTYKAIPVTTETVNEFSANISLSGVVSNENVDWLDGNCASTGGNEYDCDYISSLASKLTNKMNCVITHADGSATPIAQRTYAQNNVGFQITTNGRAGMIKCSRGEGDFILPQTKNISLAGVVVNSSAEQSQRQVRSEACMVNNNGTATIDNRSGLCESWIDSVNRTVLGRVQVNFKPGTYSKDSVCNVSVIDQGNSDNANCFMGQDSIDTDRKSFVTAYCEATTTGADSDFDFNLSCMGAK